MSVTGARRAARHPTAGVSLLEVLVALAVMAFLAVIASSLLTFSGRTLERVSAKSEIAEVALGRNELGTARIVATPHHYDHLCACLNGCLNFMCNPFCPVGIKPTVLFAL